MTDMDQTFVEYVVKAIVDKPEAVRVTRSVDDRGVLLELTVDPEDMGKIIGKAGATAKAIRTLLRVLGAKSDARYNLKIVEPEGYDASSVSQQDHTPDQTAQNELSQNSDISAKAREGLEGLDDLDM